MTPEKLLSKIKEATEGIWLEEPEDLRRIRLGIVDSEAGSYGQWFTTILFAQSEVRGLCYNATTHVLGVSDDESFTLDQLKKVARINFEGRVGFLNYVGLRELCGLYNEFLDLLNVISDRKLLLDLLNALRVYGVRYHMWAEYSFPWEVGMNLQQRTRPILSEAQAHLDRGPWEHQPYLLA